jgi:hypothetical protein
MLDSFHALGAVAVIGADAVHDAERARRFEQCVIDPVERMERGGVRHGPLVERGEAG